TDSDRAAESITWHRAGGGSVWRAHRSSRVACARDAYPERRRLVRGGSGFVEWDLPQRQPGPDPAECAAAAGRPRSRGRRRMDRPDRPIRNERTVSRSKPPILESGVAMAKKIILIVLGVIALLVGLAITAAGAAGLALGGRHGVIQSGYHAISTSTA